jgi:hypothetical protein
MEKITKSSVRSVRDYPNRINELLKKGLLGAQLVYDLGVYVALSKEEDCQKILKKFLKARGLKR